MKNILDISWELFDGFIDVFANNIKQKAKEDDIEFYRIIGIPRGGSIVGAILSHKLNIPYMEFSYWSRIPCISEIFTRGYYTMPKEVFHVEFNDKKVLIVDDILHSGETLNGVLDGGIPGSFDFLPYLEELINEERCRVACLFKNTSVLTKPANDLLWLSTNMVDENTWVQFPWEQKMTEDEMEKLLNKHNKAETV